MFPPLTFSRGRQPPWRVGAIALGGVLLALALVTRQTETPPEAHVVPLSEALDGSTFALAVPTAWLGAPAIGVRPRDRIDLIAVRPGDRASGYPVAYDLRVMSSDDRALIVQIDEASAIAVALARSSGMLLVPLLQSAR